MFSERLHDAMRAAGIFTPAELARRVGVTTAEAGAWLTMREPPDISWALGVRLCEVLKCRNLWLFSGSGVPMPLAMNGHAAAVLALADTLSPNALKIWLRYGQRLERR